VDFRLAREDSSTSLMWNKTLISFGVGLIAVAVLQGCGSQSPSVTRNPITSVRSAVEAEGWIVASDREVTETQPVMGDLDGTARVRETSAFRSNSKIQPVITEFRITDPSAFLRAAIALQEKKKTVGSRTGYLAEIPGLAPSSAFILIGKQRVFFIQYRLEGTENLMMWGGEDPTSELAQLIQQIPIEY
jgi:hypothetical protein